MPPFEIVLRFADREETRLADGPPGADTLTIVGRTWRVVEREPTRVVCEELRRESRDLRDDSQALQKRSSELRERRPPRIE